MIILLPLHGVFHECLEYPLPNFQRSSSPAQLSREWWRGSRGSSRAQTTRQTIQNREETQNYSRYSPIVELISGTFLLVQHPTSWWISQPLLFLAGELQTWMLSPLSECKSFLCLKTLSLMLWFYDFNSFKRWTVWFDVLLASSFSFMQIFYVAYIVH